MTKFTFIAEDIDGSKFTSEFKTENWTETFQLYIQFLRGSGFYISDNIELSDNYSEESAEDWTQD